jgi:hypothetical protein
VAVRGAPVPWGTLIIDGTVVSASHPPDLLGAQPPVLAPERAAWLADQACSRFHPPPTAAAALRIRPHRHGRLPTATPSRTLSGRCAGLSSVTEPARRGTPTNRTGAGPAPKQHLQLLEQLPQAQADATCVGRRSRSRVRKPWATDTKVT